MDFSPTDRDLLIRTIIGEAGDQSPTGQAAVAYSVLNRLADGGYGRTPGAVMLAPNQYEPWTTRAAELTAIPPNSRAYKQVGSLVDGVLSGQIPDPTEGATHFLNPDIVRQRRGGTLPDWAQGPGIQIGQHTFYNPRGQASAFAANDKQPIPDILGEFINAAPKAQATQVPTPQATATQPNEPPDVLGEYLKAAQEAPKPVQSAPVQPAGIPDNGIGPPKAPEMMTPVEKKAEEEAYALGKANSNKGILDKAAEAVGTVGSDYLNRTAQFASENAGLVGEGMKDWATGKTATGAGKIGLGALGYLFSPVQGVDVPLGRMAGNKEFGEKAALLMPGGVGGKVANEARPAVSAVKDLIKDVGPENIPQIVNRLESNPNLTLMDVAPAVRGNAAGLATDPRNVPAMTHLTEFQKARMANRPADTVNIFEDALGPTPNMADTIGALKQQAIDTGKNMIEPALEKAQPIPVKSLLRSLDRAIGSPEAIAGETPRIPLNPTQIRLLNLRQQITSGEMAPLNERVKFAIDPINEAINSGTLGQSKSADFTEARRLLNSARRGNTSEDDLLSGLQAIAKKQKIVGPIDDAVKMIKNGPTEYRSAEFVHGIQSRLREEASNLSKSATGSDRNMAHDLFDARENLVNAIDKASGGEYRPGLKQYAGDKAVDEAFREGFNVFSNPTGAEGMIANHPDMWQKWMAGASDAEKRAVAQGILFGANSRALNMRKGLDVPENSYAHQRISSVIGKGNADEIVRRLQDWRDISETDNLLTKNSATAVRQAGQEARAVREPKSAKEVLQSMMPAAVVGGMTHMVGGQNPILSGMTAAGVLAGGKAANKLGLMHDIASNRAYAMWASATGPQREELIDILKAASRKSAPGSKTQKLIDLVPPPLLQALPQ